MMNRFRRTVVLLVSTLLAMSLLAGCGATKEGDVTSPDPTEDFQEAGPEETAAHPKVTLASVSNSWTVTAVPLVAIEKGFFREEGLTDLEFKIVGPATTHIGAFVGGSIDFSINLSTDTLMRANASGGDVYAIAGSTNGNSYVLYGGPGIQKLTDLKGKLTATDAPGGTGELLTADILRAAGLVPGVDVQYVPVAGTISERVQAMLTGTTQAALGTISDWPMLQDQGVSILGRASDIYPDYQFAVLAASGKMLDQHPDTVKAFLKGMIRAWRFLDDPANDAEAARILKKHEIPFDEAKWSQLIAIQREFWPAPDGTVNEKGVEVILKREQEVGRVPADYTIEQLLRLEPLKAAQQEMAS